MELVERARSGLEQAIAPFLFGLGPGVGLIFTGRTVNFGEVGLLQSGQARVCRRSWHGCSAGEDLGRGWPLRLAL